MRSLLHVRIGHNTLQIHRIDGAGSPPVTATAPFSNARLLISDFERAQHCLRQAARRTGALDWYRWSPDVVIQPDIELEGGLSMVERRVLQEVAEEALYPRRVHVVDEPRALSTDEVRWLALTRSPAN